MKINHLLKNQGLEVPLLCPSGILQYLNTFWRDCLSNSLNWTTHLPVSISLATVWVPMLLGRLEGGPMGPLDELQVGDNSENFSVRHSVWEAGATSDENNLPITKEYRKVRIYWYPAREQLVNSKRGMYQPRENQGPLRLIFRWRREYRNVISGVLPSGLDGFIVHLSRVWGEPSAVRRLTNVLCSRVQSSLYC